MSQENRWRDNPPGPGEWDAPDILGWAFRGKPKYDAPTEDEIVKRVRQQIEKVRAQTERGDTVYSSTADNFVKAVELLLDPTERRRGVETTDRGIVLELKVRGDEGLPIWAIWRKQLFRFEDLRGQWCPVRVNGPEDVPQ